jgi:hypothetical protein
VSSDDDAPLWRRLMSIRRTGSAVSGPTPAEPRVLEGTVLGGSSGSNLAAVDTVTVKKATADKEATDAAVAKKAVDNVLATAVKAVAIKEVTDAATTKKATDDVVVGAMKAAADKEVTDAVITNKVADDAALMRGCWRRPPGDQ